MSEKVQVSNEQEENGNFILAMPRSTHIWTYSIDDAHPQSMTTDGLFQYLSRFIQPQDRPRLSDMISRFTPILVHIPTGTLMEPGTKSDGKLDKPLDKEIEDIATGITDPKSAEESKKENINNSIPFNDLTDKLQDKFYHALDGDDKKSQKIFGFPLDNLHKRF